MMNRFRMFGTALVAGTVLLTALVCTAAPDKDDPKKADDEPTTAKDTPKSQSVNGVLLAYKLADYGRNADHLSPLALITAADMLTQTGLFAGDSKNVKPGEGSEPGKDDPKDFFKLEAKKLLDEAEKMVAADTDLKAPDQKVLKDEIARVRKGTTRGSAAGPLMYTMQLKPGQTDTYNVKFNQDEWARIAVRNGGAPDSRLYLAVINSKGSKRADDGGHDPSIAFIPHAKDDVDYKITVTNKGNALVVYQMFTN